MLFRSGGGRLWDVPTLLPGVVVLHGYCVLSPAGTMVLESTVNESRLWNIESGKPRVVPMDKLPSEIMAARFSSDGCTLLTVTEEGTAQLWDTATCRARGKPIKVEGDHSLRFRKTIAFSPDGKTVLAPGRGHLRIWDATTGEPRGKPIPNDESAFELAFSPDSRTVLTVSGSKVQRWDATTGEPIERSFLPVALGGPVADRKSTRLNSSHIQKSRMPSSA